MPKYLLGTPRKSMTKREAEAIFKTEILPGLPNKQNGKVSFSTRIVEWEVFAKGLNDEGKVSDSRYDSWVYPRFCKSRSK